MTQGRLEEFGIYKLASQLFDEFWADSEIVGKDFRGHELVKRQTCSLDSICANTGISAEDQAVGARRD